jgi:hypothetical protein
MLVFRDARLVYLATPRTGSTAIEAALAPQAALAALRPPLMKHTSVRRYRRFVGPYLAAAAKAEFEVVAQMREPRDWLASWYRFRGRPEGVEPEKSTAGVSFDDFVNAWCDDDPPAFARVGSQARFLAPENGARVDRLYRYEDMAAFLAYLSGRLGQRVQAERLNAAPPAGDLSLRPATEARLRAVAAADFALYATLASAVRGG